MKKYLIIIVCLFLVSCEPYVLKTHSGKPEIKVGVSKKTLTSALVNELVTSGYVIDLQSENLISGLLVEPYGRIRHMKQFAITQEGDSMRVILHHLINQKPIIERDIMEEDQEVLNAFKQGLPN